MPLPPTASCWPAAFRRLCVETIFDGQKYGEDAQPPLGGCVLKRVKVKPNSTKVIQPPLGGCVLKPFRALPLPSCFPQPPLGGCVLKPPILMYLKF